MGIGLLVGTVIDQLLGDPRRGHPVALFGSAAARLERSVWRDNRQSGAIYTVTLVGAAAALGILLQRRSGLRPTLMTAAGTWAVLGGRSLVSEAQAVNGYLATADLPAARARLTHLVGRRTEQLDEGEIARAVIESLAENTSDAVVAPLFWGAVAGLPGLLGYRAVNTLDAMVGHHNVRYERFGWAAARLDDLANIVPARLSAALAVLVAPLVHGRPAYVGAIVRRDGRRHPSPNAGMVESAFAGALGVRLGGRNEYGPSIEQRPVLGGEGRAARSGDIPRATRLTRAIIVTGAALCAGSAWLSRRRR